MKFSQSIFSNHVQTLLETHSLHLPRSFLVAFSGGLDSSVLLESMNQWRRSNPLITLRAIHINHQLQAMSGEWESHCRRYCDDNNIDVVAVKVNITDSDGKGTEAAAREVRYDVFRQHLQPNEILLTAHHQDDQVETLMLRLMRGCGVEGAAAMREVKQFASGWLIRPLLNVDRATLHEFAISQNLRWIDDPSNADSRYDRNFLRNEVFPLMEKRWPAYRNTLLRFCRHAQAESALMQQFVAEDFQLCVVAGNLSILKLLSYDFEHQKQIIRYWIRESGFELPGNNQLQEIIKLIVAREDAIPLVCWDKVEVRRYQKQLYIMHELTEFDRQAEFVWDLKMDLFISGVGRLSCKSVAENTLPEKVIIKFRKDGDVCLLPGRREHHRLKKLMQEYNIPPWWRDRIPVIWLSDQIIAIPGIYSSIAKVEFLLDRNSI